ncbi:helix-turn-helix domain-containing protein [Tsukamurella sp. NPDC003166]|uniref:TetR/AcrR family transcriptional regulator n=1 Tax=Tsukamurella sp. NPDC003166 TaxID=3154444 RepID=UPI00339FF64C
MSNRDSERSSGKRGRPRAADARRAGDTAAEEILDAAAELFSSRGYAATSTRAIAEAVGIRQASLYHYFATKDLILSALLESTVQGPLAMAREIAASGRDPLDALLTLARSDAGQLLSSTFNVGALYHLPEVSGEAFAAFRADRTELAQHYHRLAAGVIGDATDPRAHLPLRLVEAVIGLRSDGTVGPEDPQRNSQMVDAICAGIAKVVR